MEHWNEHEIRVLKEEYLNGTDLTTIGDMIGKSAEAVKSQAKRYGLTRRGEVKTFSFDEEKWSCERLAAMARLALRAGGYAN